jgi:PPOX class probable F420-dependent enzyme
MLLDPADPVLAHAGTRLRTEPVVWLATARPHAVPVWFSWTDPVVTIFSQTDTAKVRHLRADPAVALHLDTAAQGTDVVLLHGRVEFGDPDDERERAFATKYADQLGGQSFAQWRATFSLALTVVVGKVVAWQAGPGGLEYRSVP